MFSEAHPIIRRMIRFMLLPYCFFFLTNWKECKKAYFDVIKDLLYIFFKLKYYPDNYGACRLWEKDREEWNCYYGSTYNSYARHKLRKLVQRFEYQILFNDKEVCEYFCRGLGVKMPQFYGIVDPEENYTKNIERIFNSNADLREVIIKPVLGHAGRGIVKAFKKDKKVWIKTSNNELLLKSFELKSKSIVQEVLCQHQSVSQIAPSSINTIRVLTLWTTDNRVVVISSSMRFGQGESFVDNWSAGGVSVGVNVQNGVLKKVAYDKSGNQFYHHPVSKISFEGFEIPYWDSVLSLAEKVQSVCPFYRLIGCDIAICEEGPVLVEVNANPDIVYQEQTSGPILADRMVYKEFEAYGLLVNDAQKNLYLNQ